MKRIFSLPALLIVTFCLIGGAVFAQPAKVQTAWNQLRHENLEEAKKAIDEAAQHEKTKDEAKTWFYRGRIYFQIGLTEQYKDLAEDPLVEAYKSFKKCIEVDEKERYKVEAEKKLEVMVQPLYKAAIADYNNQDYEGAYEKFNYTTELVPNDTAITYSKALSAYRSNKTKEAKQAFKQLVDWHYNKSAAVYSILAKFYKDEGKEDSALHVLGLGRQRMPDNKSLIIKELNLYLQTGRLKEMIPKLKKAIEVDSTNPNIYFALGTAYENLAKDKEDSEERKQYFDKAKTAYRDAIGIKSDYFDAQYNLGALYYNKAIDIVEEMGELGIDEEEKYKKLKRERDQLFAKALPHLEKALEVEPEDVNTLKALKQIYAIMKSYEKSKEMEKRLKEVNSSSSSHKPQGDKSKVAINMRKDNGVYYVPCKVNGLKLDFIFDTGASDVSISITEALYMVKNGHLDKDDIYGTTYAKLANGEITEQTQILLEEIIIGGLKLENIKASVVHELNAPLLLGQSAIEKLGSYTIRDNQLIIKP